MIAAEMAANPMSIAVAIVHPVVSQASASRQLIVRVRFAWTIVAKPQPALMGHSMEMNLIRTAAVAVQPAMLSRPVELVPTVEVAAVKVAFVRQLVVMTFCKMGTKATLIAVGAVPHVWQVLDACSPPIAPRASVSTVSVRLRGVMTMC